MDTRDVANSVQCLVKDVVLTRKWQLQTDNMAERLKLGWRPSLYLTPGRVPPMLWAVGGRPRLLVPSDLWTEREANSAHRSCSMRLRT